MNIKEQIEQLAKQSFIDLINMNYDKLKAANILNDETEELIKDVVELNGKITLRSELEIDVYEYDDQSGFGVEVPIVLDKEGAEMFLYFEAKTNDEKSEVTKFYIETIDC